MLSGCFSLILLRGGLSIFSTIISPSTPVVAYPVFAPLSHPLPILAPVSSTTSTSDPTAESLLSAFFPHPDESAVAIFILRELRTGIEGLSSGAIPTFSTSFSPLGGFQGVWDLPPEPSYPYSAPPSWEAALRTLRQSAPDEEAETRQGTPPVVLVKGPKRAGKSTFGRAALNTLLEEYERVAWLECDLGQGEFGAGGVVGLWILDRPVFGGFPDRMCRRRLMAGPPFTHPRIPVRAHFLGTYTPITCPEEYLAAIHHISDFYKYEVQYSPSTASTTRSSGGESKRTDAVPIVVNTPGWVKGLGEDLLRSIEGMVAPTHTFQFPLSQRGTDGEEERPQGWTSSPTASYAALPGDVAPSVGGTGGTLGASGGERKAIMEISPAPVLPLQARYAASDHRQLSLLSYFYSRLPRNSSAESLRWDYRIPLATQAPYEVLVGEGIKEIYLTGEGSDGIVSEDLGLALNGSVVALLERLSPSYDSATQQYIQGRPYPALDETNFLGYAFIRAVSPSSDGEMIRLHILTPLPADLTGRVSIMVRNGAMEMPNAGLLDWTNPGHMGTKGVPFFDTGPIGVGGERRKIRRNLMRKGM